MTLRFRMFAVMLALGLPAAAAEPSPPFAAFLDYGLQDFCLDIRNAINRRQTLPVTLIDSRKMEAALSEAVPADQRLWLHMDPSGSLGDTLRRKFSENLLSGLNEGDTWTLTRYTPADSQHADCTLTRDGFDEEPGQYFALTLRLSLESGQPRIEDFRNSMLDEPATRFMTQYMSLVVESMEAMERSAITRAVTAAIPQGVEPPPPPLPALAEYMTAFAARDWNGVRRLYETRLTTREKSAALIQLPYLLSHSDSPEFPRLLNAMLEGRPEQGPTTLMLVRADMRQDIPAFLKTLEQLETAWGYHPAMAVLKARALTARDDPDGAIRVLGASLDRHDRHEPAYWQLLRLLAYRQRYDDAVLVLTVLEDRFNLSLAKLDESTEPLLKTLGQSSQFRDWRKARQ